jgi:hypothetical protein
MKREKGSKTIVVVVVTIGLEVTDVHPIIRIIAKL